MPRPGHLFPVTETDHLPGPLSFVPSQEPPCPLQILSQLPVRSRSRRISSQRFAEFRAATATEGPARRAADSTEARKQPGGELLLSADMPKSQRIPLSPESSAQSGFSSSASVKHRL
ncbi:hypothetical protein GN956_G17929 [Arapaima gigas]